MGADSELPKSLASISSLFTVYPLSWLFLPTLRVLEVTDVLMAFTSSAISQIEDQHFQPPVSTYTWISYLQMHMLKTNTRTFSPKKVPPSVSLSWIMASHLLSLYLFRNKDMHGWTPLSHSPFTAQAGHVLTACGQLQWALLSPSSGPHHPGFSLLPRELCSLFMFFHLSAFPNPVSWPLHPSLTFSPWEPFCSLPG